MRNGFFSSDKKSRVSLTQSSVRIPGTISKNTSLKKEAWDKSPDGLFETKASLMSDGLVVTFGRAQEYAIRLQSPEYFPGE